MGSSSELGWMQWEGDLFLTNQVDVTCETQELLETKAQRDPTSHFQV